METWANDGRAKSGVAQHSKSSECISLSRPLVPHFPRQCCFLAHWPRAPLAQGPTARSIPLFRSELVLSDANRGACDVACSWRRAAPVAHALSRPYKTAPSGEPRRESGVSMHRGLILWRLAARPIMTILQWPRSPPEAPGDSDAAIPPERHRQRALQRCPRRGAGASMPAGSSLQPPRC